MHPSATKLLYIYIYIPQNLWTLRRAFPSEATQETSQTFPCSTRPTGPTTNSALPPSPYTEKLQLLASAWVGVKGNIVTSMGWFLGWIYLIFIIFIIFPQTEMTERVYGLNHKKKWMMMVITAFPESGINGNLSIQTCWSHEGAFGPQLWKRPCFYLHDIWHHHAARVFTIPWKTFCLRWS